jgi:hypothetical protein
MIGSVRRYVCSVDDCDKTVNAPGVCPMHYWRLRKYGTTDDPKCPAGHTLIRTMTGARGGFPLCQTCKRDRESFRVGQGQLRADNRLLDEWRC